MPERYKHRLSGSNPFSKIRLFPALKQSFREGYSFLDLRSDLMSGMVVAFVAIPLGMALAIACGVAPQHGLYTVIIGGAIVALLGGSRFQVTGPTAAFVVILAPIATKFGLSGLLVSGLLAGLILVIMSLARVGKMIQFIPYPVTTGFTSGIAVVIATLQLKDLLGLQITEMPDNYFEKLAAIFRAGHTLAFSELLVGAITLLILVLWPRVNKRIPAPLVALTGMSAAVAYLNHGYPDLDIATIGTRFSYELDGVLKFGIPQSVPKFDLPWNFAVNGESPFKISFETIGALVPSAFAIAMLGGIESLLSAVVADGMARTKHDPDAELLALGIGNIFCPFFGGIAATGAIARTTTNIRFGAKSPLSAVFHAVFALLVILLLAPYVSYLPMAALAALLIVVAYNMSEAKHFYHILRVAPKSDVVVLLLCFFLTVSFDMVVGVTVGVVLAAFLFMRRMSEVTDGHLLSEESRQLVLTREIPANIILYEIEGPLFFGAAGKAAEALTDITDSIRGVIFVLENVPIMDVTGLVAFESAIQRLQREKKRVCLVGLQPQPKQLLGKSSLVSKQNDVLICGSIDQALESMENK